MNIPHIIASNDMIISSEGWPLAMPTLLLQDVETHPTGRFDFVAGEWVKREPDDSSRYMHANYEEVAITYNNLPIALVRVRRALPSL